MSPAYKRLLVTVNVGLLPYWAAVFLNLIPEYLCFKDYSNQVIRTWSWPFFPLDMAATLAVFLGAHLTRVDNRIGDLVLTVGLVLTFCVGFMAISFWSFYRNFDPLWWGPNTLLMTVPALAFGPIVCQRLGTAENRARRSRTCSARPGGGACAAQARPQAGWYSAR